MNFRSELLCTRLSYLSIRRQISNFIGPICGQTTHADICLKRRNFLRTTFRIRFSARHPRIHKSRQYVSLFKINMRMNNELYASLSKAVYI